MKDVSTWRERYHASRPARAEIMGEIRTAISGDGDPWGSARGWMFAVAHVLHHTEPDLIPASWLYRDAMGCHGVDTGEDGDYPETMLAELRETGVIDGDALLYAGRVLDRYTDWLSAAGYSY